MSMTNFQHLPQSFEVSMTALKPRIMEALSQGKQLEDTCSPLDGPALATQLDTLNSAWSQLCSGGLSRKHQLEDALLRLGQFHEALAELLGWIEAGTTRLRGARPPGARLQTVEEHMHELKVGCAL